MTGSDADAYDAQDAVEVLDVGGTIRLGQFLKLAGLAESGAQARQLIAAGAVEVDGETETRRGRQLHGGEEVRVTTDAAERRVEVGPNLAPQD